MFYHLIVRPSCKKAGEKVCKGTCVDIQTDSSHCGSCKNACAAGQTCESGVCTTPAPVCTTGSQCGNPINCGPDGAGCFCVTGTSGVTSCAYDDGCSSCTQDSECTDQPGGICEIGSCCPQGACFYTQTSCLNPQAKRNVFMSGGRSSFDP